jgi:FKBP-type peptidyl-prolyl cis-trans isomerase 2
MRSRHIMILVLAIGLLTSACAGASADEGDAAEPSSTTSTSPTDDVKATEGFIVKDGDTVEVHYVGTLDDGSEFDSSRSEGREPLSFVVGTGQVISGFDQAVRGGQVGEVRTVRMEPGDAYGEWSEENIVEFPFNPEQGELKVGDEVFLTNGQGAIVLEVTEEIVKLDINHPLAGKALTFEVEILAITQG